MTTEAELPTKSCPFCREQVRDDAIKCRYCGSSLLPIQPLMQSTDAKPVPPPLAGADQVIYVVDQDLIRFGKFTGAILAVFVVVGAYFFGFNLKETGEQVEKSTKAVNESAQAAAKTSDDIRKTKEAVEAERAETEKLRDAVREAMKAVETQSNSVKAAADEVEKSRKSVAAGELGVSNAMRLVQDEQQSMKHMADDIEKARQGAMDSQQRAQAALEQAQTLLTSISGMEAKAREFETKILVVASEAGPSAGGSTVANAKKPKQSFSAPELARLYNFPPELDGRGQTIGIIELGGGYADADLDAYFKDLGLTKPKITPVSVDGAGNRPGVVGADDEVTLDIEVAGSVAPASQLVVYFTPNTDTGFVDAIASAVADRVNRLSVLLICWAGPEPSWKPTTMQTMNKALADAAGRGITVVAAGGEGANFPDSSPAVLAVGGTKLQVSGDTVAETPWGSAGGVSDFFPRPDWQVVANGPAPPRGAKGAEGRSEPDVSASADPASGYAIRIRGQTVAVGGTTASASLWAGFVALINQAVGKNLGFINPMIYKTLGPAKAFREVTQGPKGASGWDPATGWGSPDGRKLIAAIQNTIKQ